MSRITQEQRLSGFALRKTSLCLTIGFIVAGLSACAVKPEPVSLDQQLPRPVPTAARCSISRSP